MKHIDIQNDDYKQMSLAIRMLLIQERTAL